MKSDYVIPPNICGSNKEETEKNIAWLKKFFIPTTNKILNLMGGVFFFGAGYYKEDPAWSIPLMIIGIALFTFELTIKKVE